MKYKTQQKRVLYTESGTFSSGVPNGRLLSNLGLSVGRSDCGVVVVGAEFSLSSSSSTFVELAAFDPITNSSKMVGGKRASIPGRLALSISTAESSQLKSMSSRSDSSYHLGSLSCAPTLEITSSFISNVPCWLGAMGTRGK